MVTVILLLVILGFIICVIYWNIKTEHAKNQNARDIHRMLKENQSIPVSTVSNSVTRNNSSSADELERLVKLHNSGALSDAEFDAAKKKILNI